MDLNGQSQQNTHSHRGHRSGKQCGIGSVEAFQPIEDIDRAQKSISNRRKSRPGTDTLLRGSVVGSILFPILLGAMIAPVVATAVVGLSATIAIAFRIKQPGEETDASR